MSLDLTALSGIAGFDVTSLFNGGDYSIVDSNPTPPQSQTPLNAGSDIERAVAFARISIPSIDLVSNGIGLITELANMLGLSNADRIAVLVAYASATGTSSNLNAAIVTGTGGIGEKITALIQGGFSASDAITAAATAATGVAAGGFSFTTGLVAGKQLALLVNQIAGNPPDPTAAFTTAVQAIAAAADPSTIGSSQAGLLVGLSASNIGLSSNAGAVLASLKQVFSGTVQNLSSGDLALTDPANAGIHIANALFAANGNSATAAAANAWQGLALIQALAQSLSVSPVTALIYYGDRLNSLLGSTSPSPPLANQVSDEIQAVVTQGLVINSAAASDATSAALAIAGGSTIAGAAAIGSELGSILLPLITRSSSEGGGGEGGGEGGGITFNPFPAAFSLINPAISNHGLTTDRGIALLGGLSTSAGNNPFSNVNSTATTELQSLITAGTSADHVLLVLATVNAVSLGIGVVSPLGAQLPQVLQAFDANVPASLSAAQAIAFLTPLANNFTSTAATLSGLENAIAALITDGKISATAAYSAMNAAFTTEQVLFDVFLAATDLTNTAAAVGGFNYLITNNFISSAINIFSSPPSSDAINLVKTSLQAGQLTVDQAIGLLAVTPASFRQIFDYVHGGVASENQAVTDIVNALTAIGAPLPQIVTTVAEVAGYFFQDFAGIHSDPTLINVAAQAVLTLAEQQTGTAAQIALDVASGFAAAINYYLQNVGTLIDYVVGTAASIASLSDPAGLPLAANVFADLIADTPTTARPLSPSHAANFISAGSDGAVSLLLAVAGKISDPLFAFYAGQEIAHGINFVTFSNPFQTTLTSAVQNGVLSNAQAALIMGSALPSTFVSHLGPTGVFNFINALAGFANADPTVVAAFGAAAAAGYSAPTAIEALGLIGGAVPSLLNQARSQIVSIVQSGVGSITAATAINFLVTGSQTASNMAGLSSAATTLNASIQAGVAADIVALVFNGLATATDAAAGIGGFAAVLGAANEVQLLEYFATYDTAYISAANGGVDGLEAAAQTAIAAILVHNDISTTNAVTALQSLQAGATGALVTVIANQLDILQTDPATLAGTVGTGTSAQIQLQAVKVAALITANPADAATATILSNLDSRVAGGLPAAGAIEFLIDLANIGAGNPSGPVLEQAINELLNLTAAPANIPAFTIIGAISTALGNGTLAGSAALTALERFTGFDASHARSAIAGGIANGRFTLSQISDELTANRLTPDDVFAILGQIAGTSGVIAKIEALAPSYPSSVPLALPGLLLLTQNAGDANIRASGYDALNTLVAGNAALADQIFASVLNNIVTFPGFAGIVADAKNELFGANGLLTTGAVTLNTALTDIVPLSGATQLSLYVTILGIPAFEGTVFTFIEQKLHAGTPPFTVDQAIAEIARQYGADTARGPTTATELVHLIFDFLLQQPGITVTDAANQLINDIGNAASGPAQVAILSNLLVNLNQGAIAGNTTDMALVNAFSARINLLLTVQNVADFATSLGTLFTTGVYTAAQVVQAAVNYYTPGSPENFLTLIAALPGAGVSANFIAGGIVNAVTAGTISPPFGIQLLLVIGTQSTAALQSAAITNLAAALANGASIATDAATSIAIAITNGATNAAAVVTLLAQLPFSQPSIVSLVSGYIAGLTQGVIGASSAATAMVAAAHGATTVQQYAIGAEIAGLGLGTGELIVSSIVGASGATAGEKLNVLAGVVGQVGGSLQLQIGQALAARVTDNVFTAAQVGAAFDGSYIIGGVTTPAQLNTVIVGLLAGGSVAAAAVLAYDLGFAQEPVADIAAALSAAVSANTVTALKVVDLAANIGLQDPAIQTLISPLLAGAITGQAAIQELGSFIGSTQPGSGSTFAAAAFMSAFNGLAAASSSTVQSSMGLGLASVIASGKLSFGAAAAGLQTGIAGSVITLDQALTILIGAAASSFSMAIGETIAALVGGNGAATQTAVSDVEAAVTGHALTAAQGLALIAGMVDGGVQAAASAMGDLLQAQTITGTDIGNFVAAGINGSVPIAAVTSILAASYPAAVAVDAASGHTTDFTGFFLVLFQSLIANGNFAFGLAGSAVGGNELVFPGVTITDALVGDTVSGPGVPSGSHVIAVDAGQSLVFINLTVQTSSPGTYTFTPASDFAVDQQIVAAFPPSTSLAALIGLLVKLGPGAGATALGRTLFSIIESGQATTSDVLAQLQATGATSTPGLFTLAPLFAFGGLAQYAASQPGTVAVPPAAIVNGVYATINTMFPPAVFGGFETNAKFVTDAVAALIVQSGAPATTFVPVLAQLLASDFPDYLTAVGSAFTTLLNAGATTPEQIAAALAGAGITGPQAIVALAAAIDVTAVPGLGGTIVAHITAQNSLLNIISSLTSAINGQSAVQADVNAILASGLPTGQIVAGLAAVYSNARIFSIDVAQAIANMVSTSVIAAAGQIAEIGVYTIIGQLYQAGGFQFGPLSELIGDIGADLGDSAATLVAKVSQGDFATVPMLVHLTGINQQFSGPISPAPGGTYPNIGLAIGARLAALSAPIDDVLAAPGLGTPGGISDNNKALILVGFAAGGNLGQQVVAGRGLATLLNGGGQPDLLNAITPNFIAPAAATLLLAGMVGAGNASTVAIAGTAFAQLVQSFDALPPATLTGILDNAVANGVLTAAEAVDTLAAVPAGAFDDAHTFVKTADTRAAMATELVKLVGDENKITAADAIAALTAQAGAGSTRLLSESGRLIAALVNANLATPADIVSAIQAAITAGSLTVAQAVFIDTAIAVSGTGALATALGADIGGMIAGAQISVTDALAAVQSSDAVTGVGDATTEALLLIAVAGTTANGLQLAAGQAIGALLARGSIGVPPTIAAIDGAGSLTSAQTAAVLIGVAQTGGLEARIAVGAEFDTLIAADRLSATDVINDLDQAIRDTTLSPTAGFAVLLSLAANNTALTTAVTNELAALLNDIVVAADQLLASLFAGVGAPDFTFISATTDITLATIVTALISQNRITSAAAVSNLETAATGTPTISAKHAIGVLLDLANSTTDGAALAAYHTEAASLLARGIGTTALSQNVLADLTAGTMTADQAATILAAIANAAPTGQAAAIEVLVGGILANLANDGKLGLNNLLNDLDNAVTNGDVQAGLLAAVAVALLPSFQPAVNWVPRLTFLAQSGNPTALQVFADIEAVAAAAGGNYDNGYGLLIAEMAIQAGPLLVSGALSNELRSLVTRGLITDIQAKNYILGAVPVGLNPVVAVQVLATGIASPLVGGGGIATLVNNGQVTLTDALFYAAHSQGYLTQSATAAVDAYIKLIAALANNLTASNSLNTLSAALVQLIKGGATPILAPPSATASQIFADIIAVAQSAGSFSPQLGVLLAGMGGTTDASLQTAVGQQLGSLVANGTITAAAALADIAAAVASGQLTGAQGQVLQLAATASGGPAVLAAVGQQFGTQLASQNDPAASDTLMATLNAQLSAGQISLTQLAGMFAAIGTVAYPAPAGGSPIAAGIMAPMLLNAGITSSQMAEFLRFVSFSGALLVGGVSPYNTAVNLNTRVLSGQISAAEANNSFRASIFSSFSVFGNIWSLFGIGTNEVLTPFSDLGGFGPNTLFTILSQTLTAGSVGGTQNSLATLTSFTNSGALTAAIQLVALVRNGQLSAAQVMSAVDGVAPYVDTARLVYLLAGLASVPALQRAASQQIATLISEGQLTVAAALADIAAVTNAAPSNDSLVVAISQATEVSTLIGLYAGVVGSPSTTAVAQQLANIFTNPTGGYTQAAELSAINTAVSGGQIIAATATNLLLQLAVAAQLPPASASFTTIIANISSYVANNGVAISSVVSTSLTSVNSLVSAAAAGALIGKIESSTQAIADIIAAVPARLTPQREAAALLGLLQDVTAASTTATIRSDIIALVTSHAISLSDLVAALQAAGSLLADSFALLLGVAKADQSSVDAVGAAFLSFVGLSFGPGADPFFHDAAVHAGNDFVQVMNGTMTIARAIQETESFLTIQNKSADAGLTYLSQLFSAEEGILAVAVHSGNDPNAGADLELFDSLFSGQQAISDRIQDRVAIGASAGQLAQHVGQALISNGAITFTQSQAQDLYRQLGGGFNLLTKATLAFDLPTLQDVYRNNAYAYPGSYIPYRLVDLTATDVRNIYNTQTSGYLIDQGLAAEINALVGLPATSANAAALKAAVNGLAYDLTSGYAQTNLINEVQSGELAPDQAIAALDNLLAPILRQEQGDPNLAQWTHDLAYAWLAVKASEFIQGNYKIVTTTDKAGKHQTIQVLDSPVNQLFYDLVFGAPRNTVISGLGALEMMNGLAGVSSSDLAVGYNLAAYMLGQAAAAAPGDDLQTVLFGFGSARDFFVGGAQLLAKSRAAQQDPTSIPGVASGLILHQGKSVDDYVNFGSRVLGILGSQGANGASAALLGAGGAAFFGPLGLYGQVMTVVLSVSAVSSALGARTTAGLKGWFDLQAQIGGLAGNILAGVARAAGNQIVKGGEGLGLSFKDLFTGNFDALATDAGNLGEALFTFGTGGFDVHAVAGTFQDFGIAMANLFSGNPSAADFATLGPDLLKTMTTNLLISSTLTALENFGLNVWNDVINLVFAFTGDDPNKQPPPQPPPAPTITLPNGQTIVMANDPSFVGKKAYQDPTSTSNYGQFYHGAAIDGYIANAMVFVDTNANGVFDSGEYSTTTDASGNYALPQGISGTVIVTGGNDIATGLPLTMNLTAPTGATAVTALTTLVQQIAANNGNDVTAAVQQVNAAFGLDPSLDPTQLNPILATQAGTSGGAQLFAATAQAQNTLTLLNASGGSNSTVALAQAIANLSSGQTLDLTDPTTLTNIATSAGVDPTTAGATAAVASASNSAVQQQVASTTDPTTLLNNITAVSIVTQGVAAQQLSQSIGNASALSNAVGNFTGSNLNNQVSTSLSQVGTFSALSTNPDSGSVGVGRTVLITLNLAAPVSVDTTNGTPTLALNDGAVATYDAGRSTSTALVFDYTVQAGENTPRLATTAAGISFNGATVTGSFSGPADLSGAVSATPAGTLIVDTTAPATPGAPVLDGASSYGSPTSGIAISLTPSFVGVAEAGATVTLLDGTIEVGTATAGSNGSYSVSPALGETLGSHSFSVTATDPAGNVSPTSSATTITIAPNVPSITGTVAGQTVAPGGSVNPFAAVTIGDGQSGAIETLTITLSGAAGTLSGSGLAGGVGGVYTLTGSASAITSALAALLFTPAPGSVPGAQTSFTLSDQSSTFPVAIVDTTTSVTVTTQPPSLGVAASASYTEAVGPVVLSPSISLSDDNSTTLLGATVAITGGGFAGDVLATNTTGTAITASYDAATETLTLSGTDTLANYQTVLSLVTFDDTSANPTNYGTSASRSLTWTIDDGQASNNAASASETLTIAAVNDAPSLGGISASANFMVGGGPVTLSPLVDAITLSDPDSLTLAGARVAIASGAFAGDGDVLTADTSGTAITASYDGASETLTLAGVDTLADYRTVLSRVRFNSTSVNPTNGGANPTRSIAWQVDDGSGTNNLSNIATTNLTIPLAPGLTVSGSANFIQGGGPVTLSSSVALADPNSATLVRATVAITGGTFGGDGDVLWANTIGTNITAAYDEINETLTLFGVDTLAHYQQVLASVTFNNIGQNPTNGGANTARALTWTIDDGLPSNNTGTTGETVAITALSIVPPIATPAGTTANLIVQDGGNGYLQIFDLGNNAVLAGYYPIGQLGLDWQFATFGAFNGTDVSDILVRNILSGDVQVLDIANSQVTGAAPVGNIGLEWAFLGTGNFAGGAGTGVLLRNTQTGAMQDITIANNQLIGSASLGNVGVEWQLLGVGAFGGNSGGSDLLFRNIGTGALQYLDIVNNQISAAAQQGNIGVEWQLLGVGNFSGNVGESDLLMRNVGTGAVQYFDIAGHQVTGSGTLGNIGLEWQVMGFGNIAGNANETDMVMRNTTNGALEYFDIAHNQIVAAGPLGNIGLEWNNFGIAPAHP